VAVAVVVVAVEVVVVVVVEVVVVVVVAKVPHAASVKSPAKYIREAGRRAPPSVTAVV
jgi:hypothetical protein